MPDHNTSGLTETHNLQVTIGWRYQLMIMENLITASSDMRNFSIKAFLKDCNECSGNHCRTTPMLSPNSHVWNDMTHLDFQFPKIILEHIPSWLRQWRIAPLPHCHINYTNIVSPYNPHPYFQRTWTTFLLNLYCPQWMLAKEVGGIVPDILVQTWFRYVGIKWKRLLDFSSACFCGHQFLPPHRRSPCWFPLLSFESKEQSHVNSWTMWPIGWILHSLSAIAIIILNFN